MLRLTAFEVAKEEFCIAFDAEDDQARPSSSSSMRTIRASMLSSSSSSEDLEICEQFPSPRLRIKENLRAILFSSTEADQLLRHIMQLTEDLGTMVSQQNSIYVYGCYGRSKIDDLEIYLHNTWQNGSDILERFRQLVDMVFDELRAVKNEHVKLCQDLSKLEVKMRDMSENAGNVEPSQNVNSRTTLFSPRNSLQRFYRGLTPTLAKSASLSLSSSFASLTPFTPLTSLSLADVDELVTPGSPQSEIEKELDLASALSSGKRRVSLQSLLTMSTMESYEPPSSHNSPLETGVHLVSVSPSSASMFNTAEHGVSWLGPFVRKANSETFRTHLSNLLDIQKTLFGEDNGDDEDYAVEKGQRREICPENSNNGQRKFKSSTTKKDSVMENKEDGGAYAQGVNFLDMLTSQESTGEYVVDAFSQATYASYHNLPMSPAGILEMAKQEASSLEGNIREVSD